MKLSKQKAMDGAGKLKPKALIVKDPRFARLHSDPRFQRAFKRKLKIPIDSRFRHIFSDKRFSDPLALDKRGRKLRKPKGKNTKKGHALHQYYHLHESDDGDQASPEEAGANGGDGALGNPTQEEESAAQSFSGAHQNGKTPNEVLPNKKIGSSPKKKAPKEPIASMPADDQGGRKWQADMTQGRSRAKLDSKVKKSYASYDDHAKVRHADNTSKEDSDPDNGSFKEDDSESEDESDVYEESSEKSSASSSSSDYSSDEEAVADSPSEEAEDEKVPVAETETRRLALVNMDWDHIRAIDILAVMNSFLPKGGQIISVSVFPSEFGLQQLSEEQKRGPQGLFKSQGSEEEEEDEDEDGNDGINMERLRQYEKDKLRYYYAVVECESMATADFLYKSCDGMEFERTSNTLDLRFIPDDMKFLHDARDVATQVPVDYQAPLFETRALQHSKVKLTWDDDEPDRVKTLHQKFNAEQLNDMDFKAYLASDASDSEGGEDEEDLEGNQLFLHDEKEHSDDPDTTETGNGRKGLNKYRALLLESEKVSEGKDLANNDQDMEITFHSGLEELSKRLMDKKQQKGGDENVWEAYLRKKKEKKKLQKQTKHAQEGDVDSSDEHHAGDDPQADTGFDDPFFKSTEDMDFVAWEGTDSEEEPLAVPVAKQKKGARAQKRAELEEKKREEERSRAELELLFADELAAGSAVKGYNLKKKIKGRRKEMEKLPDKLPTVNYDDPRFSALFTSHRFAIDPTEPEFKRSAAQLRSLLEKQQKHLPQVHEVVDSKISKHIESEDVKVATSKKAKQELSLMVRSLKRKVGGVSDS